MNISQFVRQPTREYVTVIAICLSFIIDAYLPYGVIALIIASVIAVLPTFNRAWKSVLAKTLTIDTFNAFAVIASFVTFEFRSAAFIGLMLSFARYLDWRTESRSKNAIEELMKLKPAIARRETEHGIEEIPAEQVQKGDIVIVSIGARVPVDGVIVGGEAHLNEASVTGESTLVRRTVGENVVSSALVEAGGIRIEATAVGEDSTIERMAELIRQATQHKSHAERLADTFASIFLPIVLVLGVGTYLVTHNLAMVASIFLVACADDMSVAIPLAITAAIGRAAKRGIIIKGGEWLDVLGRVRIVVLDKTGTLTYGKLAMSRVEIVPGCAEDRFWGAVGCAEKLSEHPVGKIAYLEALKHVAVIPDPISVQVKEGKGVIAQTSYGTVAIGNAKISQEISPKGMTGVSLSDTDEVGTSFFVFIDDLYVGRVMFADTLRTEAAKSLEKIRSIGIRRIIMYTGDNQATAVAIASHVGITELQASMLPKDKLTGIEKLLPDGPVIMIGDGINDAPALARADVGIAMGGGGTAIASEAADVVFLSDNLDRLSEAILLGRQTTSVIRWDMAIWAITNIVGFALVFGGVIGPALAALYNLVTDFFPLLNSARLFRRTTK